MTLTAKQREYRKVKKEGLKDQKTIKHPDGRITKRVARRKLCVRVSPEAAERLRKASDFYGVTQQDLLTRMLLIGLPKYSSHPAGGKSIDHLWDESLLHPEEQPCRYKTANEWVQLNLLISSTAWNKLHSHKTATKLSKARIVQHVILSHKFLTELQKERNAAYIEKVKSSVAEWNRMRDVNADLIRLAKEIDGWDD